MLLVHAGPEHQLEIGQVIAEVATQPPPPPAPPPQPAKDLGGTIKAKINVPGFAPVEIQIEWTVQVGGKTSAPARPQGTKP
jgi:hypothetical protein